MGITHSSCCASPSQPENQNHSTIFAFGEALQAIDMNQVCGVQASSHSRLSHEACCHMTSTGMTCTTMTRAQHTQVGSKAKHARDCP